MAPTTLADNRVLQVLHSFLEPVDLYNCNVFTRARFNHFIWSESRRTLRVGPTGEKGVLALCKLVTCPEYQWFPREIVFQNITATNGLGPMLEAAGKDLSRATFNEVKLSGPEPMMALAKSSPLLAHMILNGVQTLDTEARVSLSSFCLKSPALQTLDVKATPPSAFVPPPTASAGLFFPAPDQCVFGKITILRGGWTEKLAPGALPAPDSWMFMLLHVPTYFKSLQFLHLRLDLPWAALKALKECPVLQEVHVQQVLPPTEADRELPELGEHLIASLQFKLILTSRKAMLDLHAVPGISQMHALYLAPVNWQTMYCARVDLRVDPNMVKCITRLLTEVHRSALALGPIKVIGGAVGEQSPSLLQSFAISLPDRDPGMFLSVMHPMAAHLASVKVAIHHASTDEEQALGALLGPVTCHLTLTSATHRPEWDTARLTQFCASLVKLLPLLSKVAVSQEWEERLVHAAVEGFQGEAAEAERQIEVSLLV